MTKMRLNRGWNNKRLKAFTLAEVLITLVIIGVVAALTIPSIITNYKKHVVETRLKTIYSMLNNVYNASIADYGNVNYSDYFVVSNDNSGDSIQDEILSKYVLPYLKYQSYETKTAEAHGYKNGIAYPDGKVWVNTAANFGAIKLLNGAHLIPTWAGSPLGDGQRHFFAMEYIVDIDGPYGGPNVIGKDFFIIMQFFDKRGTISMLGENCNGAVSYKNAQAIENDPNSSQYCSVRNKQTGEIIFNTNKKASREQILTQCSSGSSLSGIGSCGALIKHDGWKISSDYPWL